MITKRQKEVLDFIAFFTQENKYAPSLEEIQRHFNLASVSTAHHHVKKLAESGYLKKDEHQARALNIQEYHTTAKSMRRVELLYSVPIYGMANAGAAKIFAEENLFGYIKIPETLHIKTTNLFAVKVQGDSMNQANINGKNLEEGDFALIDFEYQNPQNGDYVLSIIDDCANLKKFEKNSKTNTVRLISESTNTTHKPIYISSKDKYKVNGKVVAVVKR